MHFTKMHGLGNDYLYVYGEPRNPEALSIRLSERHFGAGSDGMIWIYPSDRADFNMRIYNADGSEAAMCGNGIRCVGKYVFEKGYTQKTHLTIETRSGIRTLDLQVRDGKVELVTVDMGVGVVSRPMTLDVDGRAVTCTPVSVGNPHAVVFVEDAEGVDLPAIGPKMEHHPAFPGGVNVEFIQITGEQTMRMRVWERGSGITMACGTGTCASAAAAVAAGHFAFDRDIRVRLDGGELIVRVAPDYTITMTGPAEFVYEGETIQ